MELMQGLSAVSMALGLVKDLREIDRSVDEAGFKLKIAEITSALADAKIALSDANLHLNEKEQIIRDIRSELDAIKNGDFCPKCRIGRMQLERTKGHSMHGLHNFGVEDWNFICSDKKCGFEQMRIHDPHGALIAQARKK